MGLPLQQTKTDLWAYHTTHGFPSQTMHPCMGNTKFCQVVMGWSLVETQLILELPEILAQIAIYGYLHPGFKASKLWHEKCNNSS